jgi:hypothetical protein
MAFATGGPDAVVWLPYCAASSGLTMIGAEPRSACPRRGEQARVASDRLPRDTPETRRHRARLTYTSLVSMQALHGNTVAVLGVVSLRRVWARVACLQVVQGSCIGWRSAVETHRITSSASMRSVEGIVIPRAWAALRLMTSSNLSGCSTGRSAGLTPLRTLSI